MPYAPLAQILVSDTMNYIRLRHESVFVDNIREIRDDWIFNVGHSPEVAAKAIQQMVSKSIEKRITPDITRSFDS